MSQETQTIPLTPAERSTIMQAVAAIQSHRERVREAKIAEWSNSLPLTKAMSDYVDEWKG